MRILHVLDHSIPLQSGYSFRTRAIVLQQQKLGWQTLLVTSAKQGSSSNSVEEVDGLRFYRSSFSHFLMKLPLIKQLYTVVSLKKALDTASFEFKPHVIHAHSPALNGLAALWLAKKNNIRLVYEVRAFWEDAAVDHGTAREWGLKYYMIRAVETFVLRRCDAITTICDGLKSDICERGIDRGKVTLIPNAVDINQFHLIKEKHKALEKLLKLEGKTVLGFIGSFYAYEGIELLIVSLSQVSLKGRNLAVLLVGGGPEEDKLKALVESLDLNEKVTFIGRVPHQDITNYYSLVDIFVYPRLPMRLTDTVTPLKPLEAMAQGKLVVASDVGGHKELITHGVNGYLFKNSCVIELAKTLAWLLEKRELWQANLTAGRDYVVREKNWPHSVANYIQVYNENASESLDEELNHEQA